MAESSSSRASSLEYALIIIYIWLNGVLVSWPDFSDLDLQGGFWEIILPIAVSIPITLLYAFSSLMQASLVLATTNYVKIYFQEGRSPITSSELLDLYQALALMLIFSLYSFRTGDALLRYLFFSGDVATEILF